jgi:hypothetical protein
LRGLVGWVALLPASEPQRSDYNQFTTLPPLLGGGERITQRHGATAGRLVLKPFGMGFSSIEVRRPQTSSESRRLSRRSRRLKGGTQGSEPSPQLPKSPLFFGTPFIDQSLW